jgi:hypothetical protein
MPTNHWYAATRLYGVTAWMTNILIGCAVFRARAAGNRSLTYGSVLLEEARCISVVCHIHVGF